jgi:hypothetical protein
MFRNLVDRFQIKAFVLAGLLSVHSTISMAGIVEMIVMPCNPGVPLDKCGLKMSVTDAATFTTPTGQVVSIPPNTTVTVTGAGTIRQEVRLRAIVNFASTAFGTLPSAAVGPASSPHALTFLPEGHSSSNKPSKNADFLFTGETQRASDPVTRRIADTVSPH